MPRTRHGWTFRTHAHSASSLLASVLAMALTGCAGNTGSEQLTTRTVGLHEFSTTEASAPASVVAESAPGASVEPATAAATATPNDSPPTNGGASSAANARPMRTPVPGDEAERLDQAAFIERARRIINERLSVVSG